MLGIGQGVGVRDRLIGSELRGPPGEREGLGMVLQLRRDLGGLEVGLGIGRIEVDRRERCPLVLGGIALRLRAHLEGEGERFVRRRVRGEPLA